MPANANRAAIFHRVTGTFTRAHRSYRRLRSSYRGPRGTCGSSAGTSRERREEMLVTNDK
ncbi:hypothetical protein M9458_042837, partial [Cirrhinus mrigala]